MNEPCARWAIYIDVEGSTKIYASDEARFFASMDALIDGIGRIGSLMCPEAPNRLFAHQTGGDGFVIVSEFAERSPEMPIAISVVLMQMVLAAGGVAKAGVFLRERLLTSGMPPGLTDLPRRSQRTHTAWSRLYDRFPGDGDGAHQCP